MNKGNLSRVEKNNQITRIFYLDVTRVIAILCVILIHSSGNFLYYPKNSVEFMVGNIFDSCARIAVPLFVMISGALILDENKKLSIRQILIKALKLFFLLMIWTLIYAIYTEVILKIFVWKDKFNIKQFIKSIILGNYHLWYLYMLIGLYLITPILRLFVKRENKRFILYFIILSLSFQFLTNFIQSLGLLNFKINTLAAFLNQFELKFVMGFTSYYLTGWYIHNCEIVSHKRLKLFFIVIGLISSLLLIIVFTQISGKVGFYENRGLLVYIYSSCLFCLLRQINKDIKDKKFIYTLSKLCFGVYVIHDIFLKIYSIKFPYCARPCLYITSIFLTTTILSFIIVFVASKIPIVKKIFRI